MRYFKHSQHCEKIISLVEKPSESEKLPVATDVLKSWQRSLQQHGIDPSRPNQVRILTARELREYSQPIEAFLSIARAGIDNLHRHVCDLGYSTLLCDAQGITVDWRGEDRFKKEWKQAGLYLGAVWTECHEGTCSVGTGLIEQRPLTIHHGEHFRALNAELTCSSAPIFDPSGQLLAVLDVSALRSPESKDSQHLTLQLVIETAHMIETAYFCSHFPEHYILKLNRCRELAEVYNDFLLALDGEGRVLAGTRKTLEVLADLAGGRIIGRDIGELFDMNFERVQSSAGLVFPLRTHRGEGFYASLRAPQALQLPPAQEGRINSTRRPSSVPRDGSLTLDYLAGSDSALLATVERMKRVLDKNISIMLFGETGTGKEVFARAIHNASRRADKPFVAVNCAAIPESLIESELFGYTDGAFTGARSKGMRGKLLQADGGTLFLDEIGDMPASLQPRLLRVLAEKEVIPLGGDRAIPVDIQVICATHRNIRRLVESGAFREDLFYRLNGIAFELPPLRKRSDLARLIQSALSLEAEAETASVGIDEEAMALLAGFDWPGNIRQLRNALRYALAVCDGHSIGIHDLPEEIAAIPHRQTVQPLTPTAAAPQAAIPDGPDLPAPADGLNHLELAEREAIVQALIQHKWQVSKAARTVGISRATIYRKMDRYCITAPNKI
jgi:sigma-54 dependent transcriptional regulator, acetoin dehydrogenase operon transcriptional activator AcoR